MMYGPLTFRKLGQLARREIIDEIIENWRPSKHPVSCANCKNAKVMGGQADADVLVDCIKGHGDGPLPLSRLIRPRAPRSFRTARTCPDFTSMSDD